MKILVNFRSSRTKEPLEVFVEIQRDTYYTLSFSKTKECRFVTGCEKGTIVEIFSTYNNHLWIDPKIAKTKGGEILYDLQLAQFTDVRISDILDYVEGIEW